MNPGRRAPRPNTLGSSIQIVLRIRFNDGLNDATIGCDKPIDKSGIDGRHGRSRNYRSISLLNATRLSILISSIGLVHGTQEKTLTNLNKRSLLLLLKLAFK